MGTVQPVDFTFAGGELVRSVYAMGQALFERGRFCLGIQADLDLCKSASTSFSLSHEYIARWKFTI